MTKTGKPDSYWRDICLKYAQGQYHFSTGKRPGAKKWKKALEKIDACPLQSHSTKDLFGRSLPQEAGRGDTEAGRGETEAGRGDTDTGASVAGQGVQCYKCNQLVEGEKFSEHLSDHHTEEMCDTCGAKVQGTVGLLNHIQLVHYAAFIMPSPQKPPPKHYKSTTTTKGATITDNAISTPSVK
ncbi:hypothetical protein PO909_002490 [Leuciscus waleckii]